MLRSCSSALVRLVAARLARPAVASAAASSASASAALRHCSSAATAPQLSSASAACAARLSTLARLPSSAPSASSFRRHFASASKPPKRASKLVGSELDAAFGPLLLAGWTRPTDGRDRFVKTFQFDDFNAAWGVMSRVALLAEKMNHHPKWSNVYGTLKVELETHDVNGVSDFDVYMAQQIEIYVQQVKKPTLPK